MDKSGRTIALVQLKGGAGRSTIATNIAGELSKRGPTALIDADMPQGSSQSWMAVRASTGRLGALTGETASSSQELIKKATALARTHQYVVIDCPPRIAELTRAAVILSDLVLVPVTASLATLWATTDIKALFDEAALKVRQVNARIIWNMHRAASRTAEAAEAEARELKIKSANSTLGYRVAFPEAYGKGLTAAETHDKKAASEIEALTKEIIKVLKGSTNG